MQTPYGVILENWQNYGYYVPLVKDGSISISTEELTKENLDNHFFSILNIMRDGIETEFVQHMAINIKFVDNVDVTLSIFDYFLNLIMWNLPLRTNEKISSYYLFFQEKFNKNAIKNYIDDKFLNVNRTKYSTMELCNIIDDTLYKFKYVDEFSLYLCNTINDEDTILLMNTNQEFWNYMHTDLSNVPLEDVKNTGQEITNKAIKIIEESDHCLADSFATGEGINKKQFREFAVSIGTIPDGDGGIYPIIVNNSFINGGVNKIAYSMVESAKGRQAQIYSKNNVGTSGAFARILGLNNRDTRLHPNPNYSCNTRHLIKITIQNFPMLKMFNNRYYRFREDGPEYKLNFKKDSHLIGQTIYFRSPMTCASHANGQGVCYRCYGELAYTNANINIGTIAAELLSSELTQMLLSAKHLLESNVKSMEWTEGFLDIFEVNFNTIRVREDFECKKWKLIIDEDINREDDMDDIEYNEYITRFQIMNPKGKVIDISTKTSENIYLSMDLSEVISSRPDPNGEKYVIDMDDIKNMDLFLIHISNDELSATLEHVKTVINKYPKLDGMTKDRLLQEFVIAVLNGGLSVDAVHLEILLSNQIRVGLDEDKILEMPHWEFDEEEYALVNLDTALKNNPSITTTLEYQKISKTLYNPLSYKKNKPSQMDLFFMNKPQEFMTSVEVAKSKEPKELLRGIIYDENDNK